MLPRNHPDRIRIVFDDHRLVANAGLLLPATLAGHLGLRELVDHHLDLGGAPGRANGYSHSSESNYGTLAPRKFTIDGSEHAVDEISIIV